MPHQVDGHSLAVAHLPGFVLIAIGSLGVDFVVEDCQCPLRHHGQPDLRQRVELTLWRPVRGNQTQREMAL